MVLRERRKVNCVGTFNYYHKFVIILLSFVAEELQAEGQKIQMNNCLKIRNKFNKVFQL